MEGQNPCWRRYGHRTETHCIWQGEWNRSQLMVFHTADVTHSDPGNLASSSWSTMLTPALLGLLNPWNSTLALNILPSECAWKLGAKQWSRCNYALIIKRMLYLFFFFFYVGLYVWVWVWACVCQEGHKEVREQLQVPALTFHCYLLSFTTKYARLTIPWTSGVLSTSHRSIEHKIIVHTTSSGFFTSTLPTEPSPKP